MPNASLMRISTFSSPVSAFVLLCFLFSSLVEELFDRERRVDELRVEELSRVEEEEGRSSLLLWNTSLDEALIAIPSRQWITETSTQSRRPL